MAGQDPGRKPSPIGATVRSRHYAIAAGWLRAPQEADTQAAEMSRAVARSVTEA
jgi:hypothetical protein